MENIIQLSIDAIRNWLSAANFSNPTIQVTIGITSVLSAFILAAIVYLLARALYELSLKKILPQTPTKVYEEIFHHKLFSRLLYYLPILIVYLVFSTYLTKDKSLFVLGRVTIMIIILLTMRNIHLFLQLIDQIYQKQSFASRRPIKNILQVITTLVYIIGTILCITTVLNMSPLTFLGGISAISAIVLLIFKDSILGILSGIQLTANNMIQIGDWIEVPKHDADGEVIDISMQTVRVRNWNKTIVSLPVYSLIAESFINWRGMQELKGRRIKRSISFDINSVKFCDQNTIKRFENFSLIKNYLAQKGQEIEKHNTLHKLDIDQDIVSSRAITNLGTFRAYIEAYLRQHPAISDTLTLMVRHLSPTDKGIPIEVYAFCNDIRWENYESIQADVFEHIVASAKKFDLKIYQSPSGNEIAHLVETISKKITS